MKRSLYHKILLGYLLYDVANARAYKNTAAQDTFGIVGCPANVNKLGKKGVEDGQCN